MQWQFYFETGTASQSLLPCAVDFCRRFQALLRSSVLSCFLRFGAMPGKRLSFAAGLKAQGPTKAPRSQVGRALVACVREWGSAAWVFAGLGHTLCILYRCFVCEVSTYGMLYQKTSRINANSCLPAKLVRA